MTFVARFKINKQNPVKAIFKIEFKPSKVSQLENDLHFQTEEEVNIAIQNAIEEITIDVDGKIAIVNQRIDDLSDTVQQNYTTLDNKIDGVDASLTNHISDKNNPHEVTKTQVGLGNVDNTSDLDKPISTATQTALDGKVDKTTSNSKIYGTNNSGEQTTLAYGSTATAEYIVQRDANSQIVVPETPTANGHATSKKYVDDTAETKVDKVSTAKRVYGTDANGAQTTYDYDSFGKVDDVKVGNTSVVTNKIANLGTMAGENANDYSTTSEANSLYAVKSLETTVSNHISDKNNPHEVTKTQVGLGNVDNTSDLDKPISTATQTALDGKVPTSRTVNGKALSANITLDYSDVNALSNTTTINDLTSSAQQDALNSGITSQLAGQITTNQNDISNLSNTVTNNYNSLDGRITTNTNNIATINGKIPSQASSSNQLADKDFVNSSIATNTANFIGTFNSVTDLNNYSGTVTNNDYALVINSVITDNGNDWATFAALDAYNKSLLTNYDYAWVINGANFDLYRFDIVNQDWELRASNTPKASVALNTAYNRYKAIVSGSIITWNYEYTLNNSSFTAAQWAAINSGITDQLTNQITINQGDISTINGTLATFGNIVTHNTSEFATAAQGALADTALQGITGTMVTTALGYTPENQTNKVSSFSSSPTNTEYPTAKLVKDQLDLKQDTITGAATTITANNLTANKALVSNANGKVSVSSISTTTLGYLANVTSDIQNQLNGKADSSDLADYVPFDSSGDDITISAGSINFYTGSSDAVSVNSAQVLHEGFNGFSNGSDFTVNNSGISVYDSNGDAFIDLTRNFGFIKAIDSNSNTQTQFSLYSNLFEFAQDNYATAITVPANNQLAINGNRILTTSDIDQTFDSTSTGAQSGVAINSELTTNYQSKLISGTNIKTINSTSLLGNGNIDVGTVTSVNNTSPVNGNVTISIPTDTSDLTNGAGFITSASLPIIDQTYDGTSTNAQSGVAIAGAGFLKNTATGSDALTILGNASSQSNAINIGAGSNGIGVNAVAIGHYASASQSAAVALGYGASASAYNAIQLGTGTNSTAYTFSVGLGNNNNYQLLDGTTGLIPDARISTNISRVSDVQTADANLQNQIDNLKARGRFLALWDCSTGLAESNPPESPYTYHSGDYFIVGTVSTATPAVNYKPNGSSYTTGVASTTVETSQVDIDDIYYYDGTNWKLQVNTQKTVSFANIAGDPYDNTNLSTALNAKQDTLVSGTSIKTINNESLLGSGNITIQGSAPTNMVTTDTAQDISGKKTFLGEKAILFKQQQTTNKLGFTLFNPSNTELAAFEYRPNTISGNALLNVNTSYSNACYVGFRYWGTAVNIVAPKASAGDYFIPVKLTNGTNTVTATSAGIVDISSLLASAGIQLTDLSIDSGSTNYLTYDNTNGKFGAKVDTTVTASSSKLVTSGAVSSAISSAVSTKSSVIIRDWSVT